MSPAALYHLAARWLPACWVLAAVSGTLGVAMSLVFTPTDGQQGDAMRIAFVHLPALWVAGAAWGMVAAGAVLDRLRNERAARLLTRAIAPSGALYTFVALWSGALWSKPVHGEWWPPPEAGHAAATGWALALMTLSFAAWAAGAVLHRVRSMVLEDERDNAWALQLDEVNPR